MQTLCRAWLQREGHGTLGVRCLATSLSIVLILAKYDISAQESIPSYVEWTTPAEADFAFQMQSLQRQIDELRAKQSEMGRTPPPPTVSKSIGVELQPKEKEKSNYPTSRLSGFFQADAVFIDQSATSPDAIVNGRRLGDVPNGADFRRARLSAVGQAWDNVSYNLELDFAFPGRPSFLDVWLDIENAEAHRHLRVGQFRQPMGMDGLTSVRELTFLERSLPLTLLPFRQIGAMINGSDRDQTITCAVSGFRYPTDVYGGNVGDSGGFGMATRLTALLIDRPDRGGLLHVGAAYSHLDSSRDQFRYRNQPEVFAIEDNNAIGGVVTNIPAFVDTGIILADNGNIYGLELAGSYGSFYAQSEALIASIDQTNGPRLTFPGAYVYAAYLLTGERRPYNRTAAVFGRVKPKRSVGKEGGIGAWEIAGRFSHLDLTQENISGGRLNDFTVGLNWYLNPYTKFQFNYVHSDLNNPANGNSDANIFATRAQVDF